MSTKTREDVYAEVADLIAAHRFGDARELIHELIEDSQ